ncbi:hypothetical protein ACFL59_15705, partial [Planctomycetota bacterium]
DSLSPPMGRRCYLGMNHARFSVFCVKLFGNSPARYAVMGPGNVANSTWALSDHVLMESKSSRESMAR